VLLAEPLPAFRVGVRSLLTREGFGSDVVEAADLAELAEALDGAPRDVVLLDFDLPPAGGLAAIERVRSSSGAPAIVWSAAPSADDVVAAIRAGAAGFLRKDISAPGLVRTLRGLTEGEAPLSRDLAALLISSLHRLDDSERARRRASSLSGREREVLSLVADGARNKQVARKLVISEFTVKRHVQNILQKLELPSRWEAAAFYRTMVEAEHST
jgi:two-component system, NarL family, nitrate/nitrite response regulator NarL